MRLVFPTPLGTLCPRPLVALHMQLCLAVACLPQPVFPVLLGHAVLPFGRLLVQRHPSRLELALRTVHTCLHHLVVVVQLPACPAPLVWLFAPPRPPGLLRLVGLSFDLLPRRR